MANTLATLNSKLAVALQDTSNETWPSAELDDLLIWSVANLWPRFPRPLDASATAMKVALVSGTVYYGLPTGVVKVYRIDLLNSGSEYIGPIFGGAWEIVGDPLTAAGKIHIGSAVAANGGYMQLHGYGRYTVTGVTQYNPPDDYVPLVLAKARAEAYRRLAGDRARFRNWLARNQVQNVSVNELLLMINEADREALRIERSMQTFQKPVQGRVW